VDVEETCEPVRDDAECLTPGVPIEFLTEDSQEHLFSVTLPKASTTRIPGNIGDSSSGSCPEAYLGLFQATSFDGDVDFSISFTSPKVSSLIETPVADINSWHFGNEEVPFAVCLSPERETTFYVSVVSYKGDDSDDQWLVKAVFTPLASFYRRRLLDLPFNFYKGAVLCKSELSILPCAQLTSNENQPRVTWNARERNTNVDGVPAQTTVKRSHSSYPTSIHSLSSRLLSSIPFFLSVSSGSVTTPTPNHRHSHSTIGTPSCTS